MLKKTFRILLLTLFGLASYKASSQIDYNKNQIKVLGKSGFGIKASLGSTFYIGELQSSSTFLNSTNLMYGIGLTKDLFTGNLGTVSGDLDFKVLNYSSKKDNIVNQTPSSKEFDLNAISIGGNFAYDFTHLIPIRNSNKSDFRTELLFGIHHWMFRSKYKENGNLEDNIGYSYDEDNELKKVNRKGINLKLIGFKVNYEAESGLEIGLALIKYSPIGYFEDRLDFKEDYSNENLQKNDWYTNLELNVVVPIYAADKKTKIIHLNF